MVIKLVVVVVVVVYAGLESRRFPCNGAQEMRAGHQGKLFILFVLLFTYSLLSKIVRSLWPHEAYFADP